MKRLAIAFTLLATRGLTAPAFAAPQSDSQASQQQAGRVAVAGKLTDVRDVSLRGKAGLEEHRLLKVRTSDRHAHIVDVGVPIKGLMKV